MNLTALIIAIVIVIPLFILWLYRNNIVDKVKHPEEWKDAGSSGERVLYNTLIHDLSIPENQIFRNVYIPKGKDTTSEIDLIVVSKKGLFVFECKNYSGNIYGDAKQKNWIQYLGGEKNFFYNPLLQNKNHVKNLRNYLSSKNIDVPIISLISVTSRGKWKVKNLSDDDYILGLNHHFTTIYRNFPTSDEVAKHYKAIINILSRFERPDKTIREEHIKKLKKQ